MNVAELGLKQHGWLVNQCPGIGQEQLDDILFQAACAVLTPSIRASVCAAHLSFMRSFANGVFVRALQVRPQALQR
jgi:hypothetical protein